MQFNYARFRAEYIRKQSQSTFERCNETAAANKRNHCLRLNDMVHERAIKHRQQSPIQTRKAVLRATRSPNKPIEMWEYSDCGSGLIDPEIEKIRARFDWWMKKELWIQGEPRAFYWVDNESTPNYMKIYSPNTELEAFRNIRAEAAAIELAAKREQERASGVEILAPAA